MLIIYLEIVRAINHLINQGLIMYWGSAKWSAVEVNTNLSYKHGEGG